MSRPPSERTSLLPGTLSPTKVTRDTGPPPTSCCCFVYNNIVTPIIWFVLTSVLVGLLTGAWWIGKEEHKPYVLPLLLLSVLPAAIIMYVVYGWNSRSSAPMSLVVGCYIWGILACAPVALAEALLGNLFFPSATKGTPGTKYSANLTTVECIGLAALSAFVVAAFIEEGFKFIFVTWRAHDDSSGRFLTTYGIVVLAISTSLGFATLENATYILAPHTRISDAFLTAAWRSILSVPLHVVCGALGGWAIAIRQRTKSLLSKSSGKNSVPLWKAFGVPFMIHGFFDFSLEIAPAITPFLSKPEINMTTYICIGCAAGIVAISGFFAIWAVSEMYEHSKDELPREEASEWPSIDSIEEGAGCVSSREDKGELSWK
jgi:RsiW-degrading membrane proteinase PrsW (M82 family)